MNTKQTIEVNPNAPDIAAGPMGLEAIERAPTTGRIDGGAAVDGGKGDDAADPSHGGGPARKEAKPSKAKSRRAGKAAALTGPKQRDVGSPPAEPASTFKRAARSGKSRATETETDAGQGRTNARPGRDGSKADAVLKKLRLPKGVSIAQLSEMTGWQAHSVRGFLSAVVRRKLGLDLLNEVGKDGVRRYRISEGAAR